MKLYKVLTLACASLLLAACEEHKADYETLEEPDVATVFRPLYSPSEGKLPFPTNLLFSGSTDGTLNLPVANANDLSDPKVAVNALDGFSTVTSWTASFVGDVKDSTLQGGSTVRLFEVTTTGAARIVSGVTSELAYGIDYALSASTASGVSTLAITPLKPLKPKTTYMAVLTNGITDEAGTAAQADQTYYLTKGSYPLINNGEYTMPLLLAAANGDVATANALATALEPLRLQNNAMETAAAEEGIEAEDIVLAWTATTQSTSDVLTAVKNSVTAGTVVLANTGLKTSDLSASLAGKANVYIGTITLPYYLDAAAPTSGYWKGASASLLTQFNSTPVKTGDQTIPLLVTVPNGTSGQSKPAGGWPVVIFQHGITRNRTDALAVADGLAQAGYLVISMDLPLHGVVDTTSPLHADNTAFADDLERTFDLDLVNNSTGAAGADGNLETSGYYYLNLKSLLTARDNVRQGVADLFTLRASLGNINLDGDATTVDANTTDVKFLGHSLGAMVGIPFLALDKDVSTSALIFAGGGIAKLLDASVTFSPTLAAGLAASGITDQSAAYEGFLLLAQQVLDSADPVNYITSVPTASGQITRGVYFSEIVGNGSSNLSDQVIPNFVAGSGLSLTTAPLSGTNPLLKLASATTLSANLTSAQASVVVTKFTEGGHGSLLDPTSSVSVITELQTHIAQFFASGGKVVTVGNSSILSTQ